MQPNSSDSDKAVLASLEQMSSNKEAATLLDSIAKFAEATCVTHPASRIPHPANNIPLVVQRHCGERPERHA